MMIVLGVRPWEDISYFYAMLAAILSALVIFTVISEFVRGGRVIAGKTEQNFLLRCFISVIATLAAMEAISFTSASRSSSSVSWDAFQQEVEKEMGFGDKINIGPYTLVCQSYTQDDNPNYGNEWAIIDVFRGGKQITTMFPERRFYKASGAAADSPAHLPNVSARSFPRDRLYTRLRRQKSKTPAVPSSKRT